MIYTYLTILEGPDQKKNVCTVTFTYLAILRGPNKGNI